MIHSVRRILIYSFAVALSAASQAASEPTAPSAPPAPAATAPNGRIEAPDFPTIFRPPETDDVTISPDGQFLAYTERRGNILMLVLRNLKANSLKRIALAEAAVEEFSGGREKTHARLTFMRWGANGRLVYNLAGESVWSIRADGTDPKLLADVTTFSPGTPPDDSNIPGAAEDTALGDSDTTTAAAEGADAASPAAGSLLAPDTATAAESTGSAFDLMKRKRQPINVASMLRGDRYVYVEALMKDRGIETTTEYREGANGTRVPVTVSRRRPGGEPRVVLRYDVETGKEKHWGEAPESTMLLCDQQGYPRLALARLNLDNLKGITRQFRYSDQDRDDWRLLGKVMGPDVSAQFTEAPEKILGERSVLLGFDFEPQRLYFASNVGRDTFGIFAFDTKTWQRTDLSVETPAADLIDLWANTAQAGRGMIFDQWKKKLVGVRYVGVEPGTLWFDPALAKVQRTLAAVDPRKRWEIREWDEAREHYLVLATNNSEPGIYYVFNAATNQLDEIMSRAPWLTEAERNPGTSFGFKTAYGVNLNGYLTLPRHPVLKRPPLVVLCHDGPWSRDYPGYNSEAQALASMGFIVLQVNYRGSTGFGRKHLDALRAAPDTVALEDIITAIDTVTPKIMDPRLVAIMGSGYGGYLALRALQLHPERFRCAVTLDAPVDLATWVNPLSDGISFVGKMRRSFLGDDVAKLRAISPIAHPELIKSPVMLIQSEGQAREGARTLASALNKLERGAVFVGLTADESANLPQARGALFDRIRGFLNENIYHYAVKVGQATKVNDTEPPAEPSKPLLPKVEPIKSDVPSIEMPKTAAPAVDLQPAEPAPQKDK